MYNLDFAIPYGTKILHQIKIYGFAAASRAVKLKSVNFYCYAAKILSCFDSIKFKIRYLSTYILLSVLVVLFTKMACILSASLCFP